MLAYPTFWRPACSGRIARHIRFRKIHETTFAPDVVDRQTAGDSGDPGLEVPRRAKLAEALMSHRECFLGDVLGRRAIPSMRYPKFNIAGWSSWNNWANASDSPACARWTLPTI